MYTLILNTIILFSFVLRISSVNIDTLNPIIITDQFDGSDSSFGASVNLLNGDETPGAEAHPWVIVGSPKANSTREAHRGIFEPGVLWRCSLGRLEEDYCEPLLMDPTDNKYFVGGPEGTFDRKDGGWLGESMSTSNGKSSRFVTCAPRWQNQHLYYQSNYTEHYTMNGICYWRPTKQVQKEGPIPDLPPNNYYRLFPLSTSNMQATLIAGTREPEYTWAFGQSGFSLHLTDDNQMLIGAPGLVHWRGGVIHFSDEENVSLRRNGQADEFGGVFRKIMISNSKITPRLNQEYSYLGYSVASGKFMRPMSELLKDKTQFVAGAPRGNNLMGQVVIFTIPRKGAGLNILQEIRGNRVSTYFGSVLCSVDVNNDGFDDLLIGAPQFSTLQKSPKFAAFRAADPAEPMAAPLIAKEFGDEGRVFVYLSDGNQLVKQSGELNGGNTFGARFGSAISRIGDLNNDGFDDVVVGAPFENGGSGAIYIYLGSPSGLNTRHSQVILGKNLHTSLQGFGYSLSPGLDIDHNGYNDLAVGSFASSQTVVLRSKPIVFLKAEITSGFENLPLNTTEFQFQVCVSYTGKHAPSHLDITMELTMDVDAKPARVHIRESARSGVVKKLQNFKRVAYDHPSCVELTGVVVQALVVSGSPVTIKSTVQLTQNLQSVSPTLYNIGLGQMGYPRLSASGPKYDKFCADCPVQEAESIGKGLFFRMPLELPCGSDNKCVSDLRLETSFADISPGQGFIIGSKASLNLDIAMQNLGEAALSPALWIKWKKINLLKIPSNCEEVKSMSSEFFYRCEFGDILESNQLVLLSLVFDMREMYANELNDKFECTVTASTTSEVKSPVSKALTVPYIFGGEVGVSAKETTIQLSAEAVNPYQFFTHSYEVGLKGPSSLELISLHFQVPVKLSGESIIEITNLRAFVNDKLVPCTRNHIMEPGREPEKISANLQINNESEMMPANTKHIAKTIEQTLPKQEVDDLNTHGVKLAKNGILLIDCSSAQVECETFDCQLTFFKPGHSANLDFSLKILTANIQKLMKEQTAEAVHVRSSGSAKMSIFTSDSSKKTVQGYAITRIELDSANVPKWVYMASISGGFLILAALVFCFYACGCFERKKKPEVVEEEDQAFEEVKPLQSQTIPEEDETETDFSRETTASPQNGHMDVYGRRSYDR